MPAGEGPPPLGERAFRRWLEAYKAAWEGRDPEAAAALFTPGASYRESPFRPPLRGRDEIRAYWRAGPRDKQRDVAFDFDVWAVAGAAGICRWRACFRRLRDDRRVELDGVLRGEFVDGAGPGVPLCRSFEEWWHRRLR